MLRFSTFNEQVQFGKVCLANKLTMVILRSKSYIGLSTKNIDGLKKALNDSGLYGTQVSNINGEDVMRLAITSTGIEIKHVLAALEISQEEIQTVECEIV